MEWGFARSRERRHVLAEDALAGSPYLGVALCGVNLVAIIPDSRNLPYWAICQRCETLLSAMESV